MNQEDLQAANRDAANQAFLDEFGIDAGTAGHIFDASPALKTLLDKMYSDAMEALRECEMVTEGSAFQAKAQILWTLKNIPEELEKIKALE